MTEREKIAQIIAEHLCPQGRAHKTLYGAERMCYSRNNFADCEKVSECVDALIAANIGDVTEYKEIIRDLNTDVVAYRALCKADDLEQIIEGQKSLIDEYEHRAEVAEKDLEKHKRALRNAVWGLMTEGVYGFVAESEAEFEKEIQNELEQAEREIEEEGKDG